MVEKVDTGFSLKGSKDAEKTESEGLGVRGRKMQESDISRKEPKTAPESSNLST